MRFDEQELAELAQQIAPLIQVTKKDDYPKSGYVNLPELIEYLPYRKAKEWVIQNLATRSDWQQWIIKEEKGNRTYLHFKIKPIVEWLDKNANKINWNKKVIIERR